MEKYQYLLPLVWPVVTAVANLLVAVLGLRGTATGNAVSAVGTDLAKLFGGNKS